MFVTLRIRKSIWHSGENTLALPVDIVKNNSLEKNLHSPLFCIITRWFLCVYPWKIYDPVVTHHLPFFIIS